MSEKIGDKKITISRDGFEITGNFGYVRFNQIEYEQLIREILKKKVLDA